MLQVLYTFTVLYLYNGHFLHLVVSTKLLSILVRVVYENVFQNQIVNLNITQVNDKDVKTDKFMINLVS